MLAPLVKSGKQTAVDISIRVHGGGNTGQSGACMLGIARALIKFDARDVRSAAAQSPADARQPHERAQALRSARRPQGHAVLEAVISRSFGNVLGFFRVSTCQHCRCDFRTGFVRPGQSREQFKSYRGRSWRETSPSVRASNGSSISRTRYVVKSVVEEDDLEDSDVLVHQQH